MSAALAEALSGEAEGSRGQLAGVCCAAYAFEAVMVVIANHKDRAMSKCAAYLVAYHALRGGSVRSVCEGRVDPLGDAGWFDEGFGWEVRYRTLDACRKSPFAPEGSFCVSDAICALLALVVTAGFSCCLPPSLSMTFRLFLSLLVLALGGAVVWLQASLRRGRLCERYLRRYAVGSMPCYEFFLRLGGSNKCFACYAALFACQRLEELEARRAALRGSR